MSGGVAIIFPSHWHPGQFKKHELVPGYAFLVTKSMQAEEQGWLVLYLRPGPSQKAILHKLDSALSATHLTGRLYLAGDWNQFNVTQEQAWNTFLHKHRLVDVTPGHILTFGTQHGSSSSIDKWLIRDMSVNVGAVLAEVKATALNKKCNTLG